MRKRNQIKFLSVLLSVALTLSVLSPVAYALETDGMDTNAGVAESVTEEDLTSTTDSTTELTTSDDVQQETPGTPADGSSTSGGDALTENESSDGNDPADAVEDTAEESASEPEAT